MILATTTTKTKTMMPTNKVTFLISSNVTTMMNREPVSELTAN